MIFIFKQSGNMTAYLIDVAFHVSDCILDGNSGGGILYYMKFEITFVLIYVSICVFRSFEL